MERTAVVTGASRGIGIEIARGLLDRGVRVIAVSRSPERGAKAAAELGNRVELVTGDLARPSEVARVADEIRGKTEKIDVLVNNAGVLMNERRTTEDGLELTFAVNQMAPLLLTCELLDLLRAAPAPRILTVSSEAHRRARFDLTDLQCESNYSGMTAYSNSKLANILFTAEFARREPDITAVSLHPGVVDTGLLGNYVREIPWVLRIFLPLFRRVFTQEAHVAAEGVLRLACEMDDDTLAKHSGAYFTGGHVRDPAPDAQSPATALVWWETVENLAGKTAQT